MQVARCEHFVANTTAACRSCSNMPPAVMSCPILTNGLTVGRLPHNQVGVVDESLSLNRHKHHSCNADSMMSNDRSPRGVCGLRKPRGSLSTLVIQTSVPEHPPRKTV